MFLQALIQRTRDIFLTESLLIDPEGNKKDNTCKTENSLTERKQFCLQALFLASYNSTVLDFEAGTSARRWLKPGSSVSLSSVCSNQQKAQEPWSYLHGPGNRIRPSPTRCYLQIPECFRKVLLNQKLLAPGAFLPVI